MRVQVIETSDIKTSEPSPKTYRIRDRIDSSNRKLLFQWLLEKSKAESKFYLELDGEDFFFQNPDQVLWFITGFKAAPNDHCPGCDVSHL